MKIKFTIFWPVWHTVSLYKKCENYVKANYNLFIYLQRHQTHYFIPYKSNHLEPFTVTINQTQ